ncbi:DUF2191 domain-containing protein [Streptomyces mutabilis]|uniref:DUF2191 domain-containing protein n=1 Tax=Streptomyces mutabilis TaxID=67332 RepID=UPI001E471533|nr:DUF2191 domain-containing protein [Streptomyces mutabilis]
MARVSISPDAEPVVEVMVLAGIGLPQDAVEAVLRDHIARGHRSETPTDHTDHSRRQARSRRADPCRPAPSP